MIKVILTSIGMFIVGLIWLVIMNYLYNKFVEDKNDEENKRD